MTTLLKMPAFEYEGIPMTEAERFFFELASPAFDRADRARDLAFARAGAERLGDMVGVTFIWSDYLVTMHLDGERIGWAVSDRYAFTTPDQRRVIQAKLILDHIDRVLLHA